MKGGESMTSVIKIFRKNEDGSIHGFPYDPSSDYYSFIRDVVSKGYTQCILTTDIMLKETDHFLLSQMPRPVKGSGFAKGSCPIQFQRLTACPCGPNVSLPHYAFACIPRYRGLRLHRRAIDRARLFILPAEADKLPVS